MDAQELKQLVRNSYPFPIAYTHKKTLGVLDDNIEKLKCLVETAEAAIQFLALLALAQVRQDLLNPPLTPPRRGIVPHVSSLAKDVPQTSPLASPIPDLSSLREELKLANPTFGKWNRMAREAMKAYCDARDHLIVPELFDVFWFWDTSRQKLRSQRLDNKVIGPLIILRNDFHHGRVPNGKVQERVAEGLRCLHQLLEAIQFLAQYQLLFTQRITLKKTYYIHDLMLFSGCVSDHYRWESEMALEPDSVVFLHSREGRHLVLNPFIIVTDQINGVPDLLLLNNVVKNKAVYVSSQFGEVLETTKKDWAEGRRHHEALSEFLDRLVVSHAAQRSDVPVEEAEIEDEEKRHSAALRDSLQTESPLSTAEVFQQKYREPEPTAQHTSPYKFLDYYNPEDHDIFFGRDKEIRLLQQKFYNSRLLVLYGESGTGKTSLIRAGLIPRLDSESYIPVYVRVLKDPLREIKRELMHQLFVVRHEAERSAVEEERYSTALRSLLQTTTERVSKTVVIVFDQFEEFFLRFTEEVRQQFAAELAACVDTPRLDVKFLIALRSDYFASLAAFESSIPQIFTHQLQLERLTEAQALEAVIKPPEQLGIQVDEAMVQIKLLPELVSEEGIEPPLLQIVCDALYQNAQSENRQEIGMADYEAIGDVRGCLGRYLDSKLRQFGVKQPIARAVLKAFVTAEGTKRASFVEELLSRIESVSPGSTDAFPSWEGPGVGKSPLEGGRGVSSSPGRWVLTKETLTHDYLDKFVRDRLVRVEDVEGRARYELSHDYLVKHIEAWIEESEREVTKVLEVIDRAYEAYQATDLLLESSALQMIKPYEDQLVLPAEKQAFVDRSKTQVRKKRRGLLLKIGVALLAVALVVGGIFGYQTYQAYQETSKANVELKRQKEQAERARKDAEQQAQVAQEARMKAERQARIAQARRLATEAQTVLEEFPQRSLLLAVKALNVTLQKGEPRVPAAEQVLRDVLAKTGGIVLRGHEDWIMCVAFSPDNHWLVTGSSDTTARLWTLRLDELIKLACRATGRNLSYTEWDQYFRGEAYHLTCSDLPVHPSVIREARDLAEDGDMDKALALFQRAVELDHSIGFDPQTEAHRWRAKGLIGEGEGFAREGKIKEAIAAYDEAKRLDPTLEIDPQTGAHRWRTKELIGEGRGFAREGKVKEAIAAYEEAKTLDPSLDLDPRTEVGKWAAPTLIKKGKQLAEEGKVKEAIAAYEEAKTLDPSLDLDPRTEVGKWAAPTLIKRGKQLAQQGKIEEAIAAYEEAKTLDPSLDLDPRTEVGKWAAKRLVAKGEQLGRQGKIEEAIAAYKGAQTLDPTLKISNWSWNNLCRFGCLWGHAAEVMHACEQAVAFDPEHGGIRDSRGLARALTGDIDGAIEDFQAYVDWTDNEEKKSQRQRWVEALRAGENPFTPEVLEKLRSPPERRPERPRQ